MERAGVRNDSAYPDAGDSQSHQKVHADERTCAKVPAHQCSNYSLYVDGLASFQDNHPRISYPRAASSDLRAAKKMAVAEASHLSISCGLGEATTDSRRQKHALEQNDAEGLLALRTMNRALVLAAREKRPLYLASMAMVHLRTRAPVLRECSRS